MQTVKGLMNKNVNIHAALCAYRDTPLANGFSPAQLLFGRSLNSLGILTENHIDINRLRETENKQRVRQEQLYNSRHGVCVRNPLQVNQQVVVRDPEKQPVDGQVIATHGREVVVRGESQRMWRRNRTHVTGRPDREFGTQSETGAGLSPESGVITPPGRTGAGVSAPAESGVHMSSGLGSTGVHASEGPCTNTQRTSGVIAPNNSGVEGQVADKAAAPTPQVIGNRRTRYGRVSKPPERLNL